MPLVTTKPELRFEFMHGKTLTVLEGEELSRLIGSFFRHMRRQKPKTDYMDAFIISSCSAFRSVYGGALVSVDELRDLSTADSRKMDLFYRGMYLLIAKALYPDEDWEARLYRKQAFLEWADDVLKIEPGIFGVSIDLKALMKRLIKRKTSNED